uniref:Uncharacterized protein n=1 Tax=Octopus bimaculoides TaxID=37653 RepID=A0A0L8FHH7_OCTBM
MINIFEWINNEYIPKIFKHLFRNCYFNVRSKFIKIIITIIIIIIIIIINPITQQTDAVP